MIGAISMASIPDEISKFRPCKCTRIVNDNGTYRVYKYTAVKLPSGKWSNGSQYLIGKIVPGVGFCPNKRYLKELEQQNQIPFSDGITDVAYGQYALLMHVSKDVLERLNACFPYDKAAQIYSYALILCANGFLHIDQIDDFYQESILSLMYQKFSFRMGYTALSTLLHNLGSRTTPVQVFEQGLIDSSSKNIAIDGHVIRSCSENNDLAEAGYKMRSLKAEQVNLLIAYDTKSNLPLMFRTFRGSSVDKKSVIDLLESRRFTDTKFVVDRGFYSEKVLKMMTSNGNSYIIPVPVNHKSVKRIRDSLEFSSGEFIYKASRKNTARIVYYEEQLDENRRLLVYKDMDENNSKRKSFKMNMDLGESGYTQEKYEELCKWSGVYFLETTTKDPADAVFNAYKARWSIETFNNYIKNDADFNNLKTQDYYIARGLDFIMLVTGLIHAKLNDAVNSLRISSLSTFDLLVKAGHMRMAKIEDVWKIQNTRTKDLELLAKLDFIPEHIFQC